MERERQRERQRERERAQNGDDRIMKIQLQELVYNRPNLIRSRVGSVSTFGCMLQFFIFFFFLQLMCVFSSMQAKSKTEQCQCAFKYQSRARKRERECYKYVCVQFSVGLCLCVCTCSPRGAYLCHCQYVQAGSGGQLCACVQKALDAFQTSAGNCDGPCPVQKTARASHLQVKWPLYPEDLNLDFDQQQQEQQGDETGYRHTCRDWLSIRTGSTRYCVFIYIYDVV